MEQARRSYLDFVGQIDNHMDHEVIWQPFTDALVATRAPQGLSSLCFRARDFWMMKTSIGEAATVPGHMSGCHGARRRRAALTRRRRLESVPVVVHDEHPDARDVRPPEPSRSTSCQRQRTPTDGIRPTTS
jgi:hypothetical protein